MSLETPATPEEPVAESTPEVATAPAAPAEPEAPQPKPEPDWEKAYKGLQTNINRLHNRTEGVLAQNRLLAETVTVLKEGQQAILKHTVGEDEANAMAAREQQGRERAAALQAAKAAEQLIVAQTSVLLETLQEAGIAPNDPSIDWARDAADVQEWSSRVGPSVKAALRKANEDRLKKAEASLQSKSRQEIKEEAEALTQRQLKQAGVDQIDVAKGAGPTSQAERIARMDPSSDEYKKFYDDVMRGRVK